MDIKLLTINIWHGGKIWDNLVNFLHQQQPDLLLMQEVNDETNLMFTKQQRSFSVLKSELGYQHGDFALGYRMVTPVGKVRGGIAILSKFPLKGHKPLFFNEPYNDAYENVPENFPHCPRLLQHVEAKTPKGILHVFNLQGVWDLDGDNNSQQRGNMCRVILEQTKGLKNVVVAGDTNAKPTNPAMRVLESQLVSVFKNELPTSFNIKRKDLKKFPGYQAATVDMVYVSPDVAIRGRDCPNVDVSDHLPLMTTLRIS